MIFGWLYTSSPVESIAGLGYFGETMVVMFFILMLFALYILLNSLFFVFVSGPLQTGYMRFNQDLFKPSLPLAKKKKVSLKQLFFGYQKCYFRSVKVSFLSVWAQVCVGLEYLSSMCCVLLIADLFEYSEVLLVLLYFLLYIIFILWGIATVRVGLQYSQCHYILADHPEMSAGQVVKESKRLMKGNLWRLISLQLSFLGWILLSIFTLGIGLLWVSPYMQATNTAFYRELRRGEKKPSVWKSLFRIS